MCKCFRGYMRGLMEETDTGTYACRLPFNVDISKCQLNADDLYGILSTRSGITIQDLIKALVVQTLSLHS